MGNCKCIRQSEENKELLKEDFQDNRPGKSLLNNNKLEKIIESNPALLKAIIRIQSLYRGKKTRDETKNKRKLLRGAKKKDDNLNNYNSEVQTIPKTQEENNPAPQTDTSNEKIVI